MVISRLPSSSYLLEAKDFEPTNPTMQEGMLCGNVVKTRYERFFKLNVEFYTQQHLHSLYLTCQVIAVFCVCELSMKKINMKNDCVEQSLNSTSINNSNKPEI